MEVHLETLRKSEQVIYLLRGIYEQYGYEKFRMGKFEAYDFYTEHKDFLPSGQILTFTDLSGKLMALKPDVTMSIVKRTHATMVQPERMYYNESIYRASRESKEYREIYQVGLEYIGKVTIPAIAEQIALALKSLACIAQAYVLDLSHMGFIGGLLSEIQAPERAKRALLACVESKNTHELSRLLEQYEIDVAQGERLCALATLGGPMEPALRAAEKLVSNPQMQSALEELREIWRIFKGNPAASALRLDFSIAPDSKYYNGLTLRGYIQGVPKAVLSGGRYDLLLRRMGVKELEAIGFAIYFDEVERHLKQPARAAYDAVVLYDAHTDPAALHSAVEGLVAGGLRVFASIGLPADARGGKPRVYQMKGDLLEEQV